MTEYSLEGAHALYRMEIPAVLDALVVKYPDAELQRVELFWKTLDRSIAATDTDSGTLRLNAYWFSKEPSFLIEASKGARGWHCCLGQEPRRVLTHEYGHSLMAARPWLRDYARPSWAAATRTPTLASSGYGLVDEDEWWAEEFSCYELGALNGQRAYAMKVQLARKP